MSAETCAVLTAVFPLILLTVVLERRGVSVKLRRRRWFRSVAMTTVSSAILGLILTVFGVQAGGLQMPPYAVLAWLLFAVACLGFGFMLLAHMATTENDEDNGRR